MMGTKKITDFFHVIDTRNFEFNDNILENRYRDMAVKTHMMKEKIKYSCLAGRFWRKRREKEKI